MALNVSLFASVTQTTPTPKYALSWAELVALIGPPKPYLQKEAAPLFSPAEWLPGFTRGKAGIAAVHFGVLDLDHWTSDAVGELISRLTAWHLTYSISSTWSHGEKGPEDICARLLVPFSRPVLPSEWRRFWEALNDTITGGKADPKCKDISRSYFYPSFNQGAFEPFSDSGHGADVDVDAILARAGGAATRGFEDDDGTTSSDGGADISREALKALGRKLTASTSAHRVAVGHAILRMCKGEPYAKEPNTPGPLPEGRNDMTFRMVATICEHHAFVDPPKLAAQFAASLEAMEEPTLEQVEAMVVRQQAGARSAHATLIREALGRSEPYSDTELQTFADRLDISLARLRRRWIVQRDRTYYIFKAGTYHAWSDREATNAAAVSLAPAIRAGVDTQKITPQGVKQKTADDLVRDYGVIARSVEVDMVAKFPRYDEDREVMIEASCPIQVQARRHDDVAEFFKVFAGQKHERLLQWISVLPALSEPCAALYLEGRGGSGKSMVANGLAQIWSPTPTTLDEALGNFNESLARCPLVFGDEAAPVDHRGRVRTDHLREFIQARSRPFTRKYRPNATLVGCARLILAANNRNLIRTAEHLTPEDIEAIVARIFYLRVSDDAVAYLTALPPGTTKRWVADKAMAEHAMYLSETIVVPRTNRFLVAGESSDLSRELAVTTGLRTRVCEWLVGYLLDHEKLRRIKPKLAPLVRVSRGRYLVNSRVVAESWLEYVQPTKDGLPDPMSVARALAGLSSDITLRLDDRNVRMRNIHMDLLVAWAEQTDYATHADIEAALVRIEAEAERDAKRMLS